MMIPTLIFGVAAAAALGDPLASFMTPFLLLCAVTLVALAGAPFAAAAALRYLD
jgi:heme exporter protein B